MNNERKTTESHPESGEQRTESESLSTTPSIISRREAIEKGLIKYYTGKECPKGHRSFRYTKSGGCVTCSSDRPSGPYRSRTTSSVCMSHEDALKTFSYCPDRGEVHRLVQQGPCDAGTRCGSVFGNGYRYVSVQGVPIPEHRLIWFLQTGRWPENIDHKDGNRTNNKWSNLRECSHFQNMLNTRPIRGKYKGVTFNKKMQKWVAQSGHRGKNTYLGTYDSEEDAARAYDSFVLSTHGPEFVYLNFP